MQITMFDGGKKFLIDKPIRLIELFGGYGSQHFALDYLGVKVEQWRLCEWAVKSIQAYKDAHFKDDNIDYSAGHSDEFIYNRLCKWGISANYNEPMTKEQIKRLGVQKQREIYNNIKATHNLVNIQQAHGDDLGIVDKDKYCYVMTYSFPCQDLSSAGLGKGMEKGSGTRSGMLWEVERLLDECKELPQVLLMENVPEVIGTNNIKHFAKWLEKLESLGYKCYWKVLNAKDYGVPQNRERCFMVSILGDYYYEFPQAIPLEHRLKDLLDDNVDEKYYLSDKAITGIENTKFNSASLENRTEKDGIMPTILARDYKDPKLVIELRGGVQCEMTKNNDNFIEWKRKGFLESDCRAWKDNQVSGTLTTGGKVKVLETQNLKQKLCNELIQSGKVQEYDVIRHSYSTNRMEKMYIQNQTNHDCSPTLDTRCDCLGVVKDYRIRKLTPKECFRLMGVRDEDFENIAKNQSNASLYHLAGDSIVVDVLMAIFGQMISKN